MRIRSTHPGLEHSQMKSGPIRLAVLELDLVARAEEIFVSGGLPFVSGHARSHLCPEL
jgi:hypothetical protein